MKVNKRLYEWRKKYKNYYLLKMGIVGKDKKDEMKEWIKKNCSSKYSVLELIFTNYYCFLDETDAMAFKLRWL